MTPTFKFPRQNLINVNVQAISQTLADNINETPIDIYGVVVDNTSARPASNLSIGDVTVQLAANHEDLYPGKKITRNQVLMSYSAQLKDRKSADPPKLEYFDISNQKFEQYENTLGISAQQPIILAATPFISLFEQGKQTAAGDYIDLAFKNELLDVESVKNLVRESLTKNDIKVRKLQFSNFLKNSKELSQHLLQLLSTVTETKRYFDLRIDLVFRPKNNIRKNLTTVVQGTVQSNKQTLTPIECLKLYGYQRSNISNWSSTKIWLTLVLEAKNIISGNSKLLLNDSLNREKNDNEPIKFQPQTGVINIKNIEPVNIGSLEELSNIRMIDAPFAVQFMTLAWSNILTSQFKNTESKIVGIANLLSKELSFNKLLTQQSFVKLLDEYGYSANDETTIFDAIFGRAGIDAFDIPTTINSSLTNLSYAKPNSSTAVLTFEESNISGDNGVITSGMQYYVDDALKNFDVKNIKVLSSNVKYALKRFESFSTHISRNLDANENVFNPLVTIDGLLKQVVDDNNQTNKNIRNDKLTSVFSHASTNSAVKSNLFLLMILRIFKRNTERAPVVSMLIGNIVRALTNELKETKTQQSLVIPQNNLSEAEIKNLLTGNSYVLSTCQNWLEIVLKLANNYITSNRLRYNARLNTIILMLAFELFISLLQKFGSKKLIGKRSKNQISFLTSTSVANYRLSIAALRTGLLKEAETRDDTIKCLLNILRKLDVGIDEFISTFTSSSAKTYDDLLRNTIGSDNISMLYNQQQISLISTIVSDVLEKMDDSNQDLNEIQVFEQLPRKYLTALKVMSKLQRFTGMNSFNNKILSIGIPQGFVQKINNQKAQKSYSSFNKQNDIVTLQVYKIDVLNQDIVYKPLEFKFDMSRFVVKNDNFVRNINENSTFEDVLRSIPTRDWLESFEEGTNAISYWEDNSKNKNTSLTSTSYDFLTDFEKYSIIRNHITSALLETYVKLTTSLNIAEHKFEFTGDNLVESSLLTKLLSATVENSKNVEITQPALFKLNEQNKRIVNTVSLTRGARTTIASKLTAITPLKQKLTNVSDGELSLKRIVMPKQFDRIFHVSIDSDEFTVDVYKTLRTPSGKRAFAQAVVSGYLYKTSDDVYKIRERTSNDISFERYFVAISV